MKAQDIMTRSPACCTPTDSAQRAAELMREYDCGCLPVVEDQEVKRVVGVVTDRDLTCRGLASGHGPDIPVRDLMSSEPSCCTAETDVREVERIMAERQVRRVPVIDHAGCCVGMVSQADLARGGRPVSDRDLARVIERVSEPTPGARSTTRAGNQPDAPA